MTVEQIKQKEILKPRPYQNEAISAILNFVKNILRGIEDEDKEALFKNSAFLNMATGSGKTFTIGKALEYIIKLRNRYNGINEKEKFKNLKIVAFTHRIDLINQFGNDLAIGRDSKKSIINDEILENFNISTKHSKIKKSKKEQELNLEQDNIVFTTYQTARNNNLIEELDHVDIILVDELHNVKKNSDYFKTIQEIAKKGRNGKQAIIIGVTATPNNHTREIFGEEIFDYGLEKYLNSEYSPSVEYNLVTNSKANEEIIEKLKGLIELSKNTQDFTEKKNLIKKAEELFTEIMSSFNSDEELVDDLIKRIGNNGEIGETIIFCDRTERTDELANIINEKLGKKDFAISFHSKNDENKAIERFRDKEDNCKIILSVGKLNEGIDLPKVENVIFWRGTDSETIFFQQFGRGLRGNDLVKYFDYVGGIKNFAWINKIFQNYNKIRQSNGNNGNNGKKSKFNLVGGAIGGINTHNVNLFDLGLYIVNAREELEKNLKEEIKEFFSEKGFEYYFNLTKKEISQIEFNGYRIRKIASLSGWNNPNKSKISNPSGFREFLYFIFDKEKKEIGKKEIKDFFNKKGFDYYFNLTQKEINEIEFNGYKIRKITSLSGWDSPNKSKIGIPSVFREFLSFIFDKKLEKEKEIGKKEIKDFFNKKGFDYYFNLTQKEIKQIEFNGYKIKKITSLSGWNNPNKVRVINPSGFREFLSFIFDKKLEKEKEIGKKEIKDFFNKKGFNYYFNLKQEEIKQIEFNGYKINKIVSLSGWNNPNKVIVRNPSGFREFLSFIFG